MDVKQCVGCLYWRTGGGDPYCSCYLDTGVRREHDGGKCLSRISGKKHRFDFDVMLTQRGV